MTAVLTSVDFPALGTTARLVVAEPRQLSAARLILEEEITAIDRACSRFRADSELVAVNGAGGRSVPVSPLLAEAVATALRAAEITDGDVDPTVGTALVTIGYDRDFGQIPEQGPPLRVTLRPPAGWRRVELDFHRRRLTVPAGTHLDLGATAKALAADRAAARIADAVPCGVLVSLGGDIAVGGPPPPGGWIVRIQSSPGRPEDPPAPGPAGEVAITTGGLATSSVAVRRWRRGGHELHHIVDPRTGHSVDSPWHTVTVAAATCVDANIASTAAVVRGRAAIDWLRDLGLPARLVDHDGRVHTVAGWPSDAEPAEPGGSESGGAP